ncbi:MAG: hypothetical protein MRY49_01400 [Candidatus Pacebacteria bacterium]|nr:hypothetical protein [Candidatus Paceibacterota bacterium]
MDDERIINAVAALIQGENVPAFLDYLLDDPDCAKAVAQHIKMNRADFQLLACRKLGIPEIKAMPDQDFGDRVVSVLMDNFGIQEAA